ncbi:hypothetical protein DQ353_10530 [Arthrobacter sp. AQ5-05]|uniref:hypothetical protein n=1 Tax=Arthrobacter sp. AQ5-05 TaxID=2184581 RepID=UPI000DCC263B|nr:hypothetical protein [Arthrobacter sp. AQ5-05]RAX49235.1 hypothetical protein DQ353_10530 [Arthrobacter sp. AQ5-05]
MTNELTWDVNALTALVRLNEPGLDACEALSAAQIAEVSRWRARDEEPVLSVASAEVVRLAKRIGELDKDLAGNNTRITEPVKVIEAAPLPGMKGFGVVTAATCLAI